MSKTSRIVKRYPKHARVYTGRTRLVRGLQGALIVVCLFAAVVALTVLTIGSVSAQTAPRLSAAKLQLEQSQAQWHAVVDKKQAPKGKISLSSCQINLHHAPVISRLSSSQMAAMHNAYASFASVVSVEHQPYFIYGENGKFVVQALPLDPCKVNLNTALNDKQSFQAPTQTGNLLITSVQGDSLTYQTASGIAGSFDYVTGQYR